MKPAPIDAACVCMCTDVQEGGPVVIVAGNAPAALKGAKWATVRTWACLLRLNGRHFRAVIKTEADENPPSLQSLIDHQGMHPQVWLPYTPATGFSGTLFLDEIAFKS